MCCPNSVITLFLFEFLLDLISFRYFNQSHLRLFTMKSPYLDFKTLNFKRAYFFNVKRNAKK